MREIFPTKRKGDRLSHEHVNDLGRVASRNARAVASTYGAAVKSHIDANAPVFPFFQRLYIITEVQANGIYKIKPRYFNRTPNEEWATADTNEFEMDASDVNASFTVDDKVVAYFDAQRGMHVPSGSPGGTEIRCIEILDCVEQDCCLFTAFAKKTTAQSETEFFCSPTQLAEPVWVYSDDHTLFGGVKRLGTLIARNVDCAGDGDFRDVYEVCPLDIGQMEFIKITGPLITDCCVYPGAFRREKPIDFDNLCDPLTQPTCLTAGEIVKVWVKCRGNTELDAGFTDWGKLVQGCLECPTTAGGSAPTRRPVFELGCDTCVCPPDSIPIQVHIKQGFCPLDVSVSTCIETSHPGPTSGKEPRFAPAGYPQGHVDFLTNEWRIGLFKTSVVYPKFGTAVDFFHPTAPPLEGKDASEVREGFVVLQDCGMPPIPVLYEQDGNDNWILRDVDGVSSITERSPRLCIIPPALSIVGTDFNPEWAMECIQHWRVQFFCEEVFNVATQSNEVQINGANIFLLLPPGHTSYPGSNPASDPFVSDDDLLRNGYVIGDNMGMDPNNDCCFNAVTGRMDVQHSGGNNLNPCPPGSKAATNGAQVEVIIAGTPILVDIYPVGGNSIILGGCTTCYQEDFIVNGNVVDRVSSWNGGESCSQAVTVDAKCLITADITWSWT